MYIKKSKIPRNKLNQGDDRHILWKLGDTEEGTWSIQINGKIFCVKMEHILLLKCLYYSKQPTNLMQSLSKYPWHFS